MPGDELLAIEYLDIRGSDGLFRKYRMMIVDGTLFPLHLAIASDWKGHYCTAGMDRTERIAEKRAFLRNPATALGESALAAVGAIATMNLLPPGEGATPESITTRETVRNAVAIMLK